MTASPYLNTAQAAEYLGLSPRTLEKLRVSGGSPPYRKHRNRVLYSREELTEWSEERRFESTSDESARNAQKCK